MASSVESYEEYMRWLGIIVSRWADIDHSLVLFVTSIIGHKKQREADVIYHTFGSFRGRVDLLKNLATHCIKGKRRRTNVLETLQRVENMWKERNNILHSPHRMDFGLSREEAVALLTNPDEFEAKYAAGVAKKTTIKRRTIRPRKQVLYDERRIPLNELKNHAARLEELQRAVIRL